MSNPATMEGYKTLHTNIDKHEKVRNWIESMEDDTDDIESIVESSVVDSSDDENSDSDTYDSNEEAQSGVTTTRLGTEIAPSEISHITESIKEMFNGVNNVQMVGNVNIENSTGVHIGNITNINGNIQIIHAGCGRQRMYRTENSSSGKQRTKKTNISTETPEVIVEVDAPSPPPRQKRQTANNRDQTSEGHAHGEAFIKSIPVKMPPRGLNIIPRRSWLAQRPLEEPEYIEGPIHYVIISHTASESSERQAQNVATIRDIQCLHIEARGWNDIAYNFLIGCDGNVYEGRGWGVVGAHTVTYNNISLGISFIGCFMREMPTAAALNVCKRFLKKAVDEGHIAPDYRLICHCQCSSTESPGRLLFEEIQTWEHFYNPEDDE